MLINDLISLAEKALLSYGWAVWLFVGLVLTRWTKYERSRLVVHGPSPRKKSGVRPPAARPMKGVLSSGDAFGELEALLEQPTGLHRTPGESPILSEPSRSAPLAAPQSLP
jgi:hypothetical protein